MVPILSLWLTVALVCGCNYKFRRRFDVISVLLSIVSKVCPKAYDLLSYGIFDRFHIIRIHFLLWSEPQIQPGRG